MTEAHDRSKGLGGTDARLIMEGSWYPLWQEKTGRVPPEDLTDEFRVQLGIWTEAMHLRWIAKRQRIEVGLIDRTFDPAMPWRWISPDGWDATNEVPIEVKHSRSGVHIREMADYYMAQLQHCMSIIGTDWMWFSVIPGNDEPLTVKVERDADYIERLLEMEKTFWWHVTEDVAPEILPSAKLAAASERTEEILVGGFKADLDMSTHNHWTDLANDYWQFKPAAKSFEEACLQLKELVPADRRRVYGKGIQVVRDKRGRLSIREHEA